MFQKVQKLEAAAVDSENIYLRLIEYSRDGSQNKKNIKLGDISAHFGSVMTDFYLYDNKNDLSGYSYYLQWFKSHMELIIQTWNRYSTIRGPLNVLTIILR